MSRIRSVYDHGFSRPDDRFIPVSPEDLVRLVSEDSDVFGSTANAIDKVARLIHLVLEQEKTAFERLTVQTYSNLNPDRETVVIDDPEMDADATEDLLFRKLGHMLEKANFEQLTPEQVEAAINTGNTHGMRVHLDFEQVKQISVWVRGRSEKPHRQRTLAHPLRGETVSVATFNRLVIVVSLKRDEHVHVRLFKDIPVRDIEALMPHAKVKMNRRDAIFMVGGGAGAAWSVATKLTIASVAAVTNLLWLLALPLAGLSWKLFSGYRRALKDRDSNRAKHLYFQSLGSNRSAIHMLASMICEEEIKEALLLYAFCTDATRERLKPESLSDLDRQVQNYLKERLGIVVDFDIADAIETLDRLELWSDRERYIALPPDAAEQALIQHWSEQRTESYHRDLLGIHSA